MNKNAAKRRMVMAPTYEAWSKHLNWLRLFESPQMALRVECERRSLNTFLELRFGRVCS